MEHDNTNPQSGDLLWLARNATEASQVLQRLNGLLAPLGWRLVYDKRIDKSWLLASVNDTQRHYTLADAMEAAIEIICREQWRVSKRETGYPKGGAE